jgi:hypothetical protein
MLNDPVLLNDWHVVAYAPFPYPGEESYHFSLFPVNVE